MNTQEIVLPENCCAKCGFFYGVASHVEIPSQVVFDPDLIRIFENLPADGYVSNMRYQETNKRTGAVTAYRYTSGNTRSLNCLWNTYSYQIVLQTTGSEEKTRDDIHELIRKDRKDECRENFFLYHPGFSAKEHAEIRLQEQREQEQREFQDRQNKLFLQLETTAAERDLFWKQKVEKADQKEDSDRSLDRWITIIFALLATIISFINLIITFRNPNP